MKGGINIDIKIVGADCSNGIKLSKMVNRAIKDTEIENIKVEEIDSKEFKKYGITNIPGLVINGKKFSEGKVLSEREIKRILLFSAV